MAAGRFSPWAGCCGLMPLITDGVVPSNGIRICLKVVFWWDDVPYMPCPVAEFQVVRVLGGGVDGLEHVLCVWLGVTRRVRV